MKLLSIQIALFSNDFIPRCDFVWDKVKEELSGLFDMMPTINELPNAIPPEIPRVQAKSSNNRYLLNVSKNRVDFTINNVYENEDKPYDFYETERLHIDRFCKMVNEAVSINRIGIVFTLFEEKENNVKAIFEKYLKDKFTTAFVETGIRMNKQTQKKGVLYNNLKNIESATLIAENKEYKGIVIQLDTNNVVAENRILTMNNIKEALSVGIEKIKEEKLKELI